MTGYLKIWFLLCFALASYVEGSGSSCEDIDHTACAAMGQQNANVCSDSILSQTACPKYCGKCPVTCYSCNTTSPDVSSCNTVTCDNNKQCMVKMSKSTRTGFISYSLGCAAETVCNGGQKRTLHSRSMEIKCCDNDLCNIPLVTTTTTSTTSPTTVPTTRPTTTTTPATTTAVTTARDPCATMQCVHGKCSLTWNTAACNCDQGYVGKYCNIRDPCSNSPCKHGVCHTLRNGAYNCTCNSGFTGTQCDTDVSPCASNPCQHGTCTNYGNRFWCTCPFGYSGTTCNIHVNPCASNPCQYGTCSRYGTGNIFRCTCLSGYSGKICNIRVNPCASNPCQHGTCSNYGNGFRCTCHSGYTGSLCNKHVNPCATNPCQHGICSNYGNGFRCTCQSGYSGITCNIQNLEGKKIKIVAKANDKFWHFDGGHHILKAVTSLWQPNDNFVKFMFEKQLDGSYKIKSVAMPIYMYDGYGVTGAHAPVLNGNDNTDDNHMRYYVTMLTQDYYTIKTKATGRYVRLDENQYVTSKQNLLDNRSLFKLVEV